MCGQISLRFGTNRPSAVQRMNSLRSCSDGYSLSLHRQEIWCSTPLVEVAQATSPRRRCGGAGSVSRLETVNLSSCASRGRALNLSPRTREMPVRACRGVRRKDPSCDLCRFSNEGSSIGHLRNTRYLAIRGIVFDCDHSEETGGYWKGAPERKIRCEFLEVTDPVGEILVQEAGRHYKDASGEMSL